MNSAPETPKASPVTPRPDLAQLALVIGNVARWQMLRELTDGDTRSIGELAAVAGCSYDSAMKHLALMRTAGVLVQGRGSLYRIPPQFLPTPGQPLVDFGHCLLRLDAVG